MQFNKKDIAIPPTEDLKSPAHPCILPLTRMANSPQAYTLRGRTELLIRNKKCFIMVLLAREQCCFPPVITLLNILTYLLFRIVQRSLLHLISCTGIHKFLYLHKISILKSISEEGHN